MTCEITYKPIRSTRDGCRLNHLPTPLRLSNVGLFIFMARVVMSYLNIRYDHRSNTQKERACHAKKNHAQCFVIDADSHIAALDELVNREQRIIRLSKRIDVGKRDHLVFFTRLTSTTVSETLGDGRIENVANIRSGNSCVEWQRLLTTEKKPDTDPTTHFSQL
jgi:hypothetical protein